MKTVYGCILAGERDLTFWPKARLGKPAFLLSFDVGGSLLRKNYTLLDSVCEPQNRFVIVPDAYTDHVKVELPEAEGSTVIAEPASRGSLNSLALIVSQVSKKDPNAVFLSLPSDLCVKDEENFRNSLEAAVRTASISDAFVTLGSKPTYPEASHFYLKLDPNSYDGNSRVHTSIGFLAQPGRAAALRSMESESTLWCSGVLAFKASVWWNYLKKQQNDVYQAFKSIKLAVGTGFYRRILTTELTRLKSADLWSTVFKDGASSKSKPILAVDVPGGWELLNNWRCVSRIANRDGNGNTTLGPTIAIGSTECILETDKQLLVAVGLQDIVVVATDDVILVCNKNKQEEVKTALNLLRSNGMQRHL